MHSYWDRPPPFIFECTSNDPVLNIPEHHHCLQKAHPHWPIPSLWFTPSSVSETWYVKCLYDRAKHLTSQPSAISKEKKHLSSVLVSNGYRSSFAWKLTKTTRPTTNKEPTQGFKSTAILPYIKGVSEVLCRCLQQQGVRTVFKSDTTLRSHLVRLKDILEPTKQDGFVYKILCECSKVYIGETGRAMQDRIKETRQRYTACSYANLRSFGAH